MYLCCMYINDLTNLGFMVYTQKKWRYQPVADCTYWTFLGPYDNWNIIELTPKSTSFEAFDEIHQVVHDEISDNMASLFQSGMYGAINTDETTKNGFYVIQFISEVYALQKNTIIGGQVISDGELIFKAQYFCSMQENTNFYWKQQPLRQTIIVTTRKILHPRLNVIIIRYVQDVPKNVCNKIQAKKSIQRNPITIPCHYCHSHSFQTKFSRRSISSKI